MIKLVVLSLNSGNLIDGFPNVTARLGKPGNLYMQFLGHLPPAPEIPQLLRNWRLLYEALYQYGNQSGIRSGIEIVESGITNISEGEFSDICEGLETAINTWLNTEGFRKIDLQLRTQLKPSEQVRVIVESDDSQVWKLPWHLWQFFQDYRHAEIALSTPEYPSPIFHLRETVKSKVKILAILGNSAGIDVEKDQNLLRKLPNVELTWLVEPNRQQLNDQLWQEGWDILFFAGHSSSGSDATNGRIYINQHSQNNSLTISELELALSHAVHKGLKLAIFNSCDGLGLARDLAVAKIPLPPMIVMREPVADRVAQEFLKYFLGAYASGKPFALGKPFHIAVRQAREQLKGIEDEFPSASWLPIICQHPAVIPLTWAELGGKYPDRRKTNLIALILKFTALFLVGLISSYLSFGFKIAPFVNEFGLKSHHNGQLLMAQQYYHLAAFLDWNYPQPYYNLGWLCDESLNDSKCAIQSFKQAAIRGLPDAYAELARLEMKQNNTEAVLKYTSECLNHTQYNGVKAACLKNRGWARFKQERFDEAEVDLRSAIALSENSPHSYCLLAQILERKGNKEESLAVWKNTLRYSKYNVPEEDECIGFARQYLQAKGNTQ
ncbi:CHAT domain-containing tetratricopeptide repeat protein [Limnofasciculus baicalensis]|uniref:CHAT domain-containing protein n=1 Tax=Limnofasciculus baicalensis BBK-W-15 TaxID=2699891 RepID=A0AAE3KN74_9CYAN|nr:CHAT domain-containing protein [Limnofasciculus baicalensis]MCP2730034.1 CHAT domain-containing protein [Limnofasciculus baicalensis BBK-W-15]